MAAKKKVTNRLTAIKDSIIFQFVQKTVGDHFQEMTASGFTIMENKEKQLKIARWGKVLSVGKAVKSPEIVEGAYILIEPLMWTPNLAVEGEKIWRTTEEKVMCVADECPIPV